jgi:phosphoribosylanthranilate isomerase
MIRVKICGLRTSGEVRAVAEAGGDAIGAVIDVPGSPRSVDPKQARMIFASAPPFLLRVAVTVPNSIKDAVSIYESTVPDILQVHPFNSTLALDEIREGLDCRLIAVLPLNVGSSESAESTTVLKKASEVAEAVDAVLVDARVKGLYGGTGIRPDWSLARRIRDKIFPRPLILAGGLKPDNVVEGIRRVMPYAVDVSSGVESEPGVKDEELIRRFISRAKGVDTS